MALTAVCLQVAACAEPGADQAVPATAIPAPTPPGGDTIQVLMDEYSISMPLAIPAGPHPVRFVNAGFEEHNIYFRRKGSASPAWVLDRRLNPGERRVAIVELEPGPHTAICDFSGHDGRGMFADFIVEPVSGSSEAPDSAVSAS